MERQRLLVSFGLDASPPAKRPNRRPTHDEQYQQALRKYVEDVVEGRAAEDPAASPVRPSAWRPGMPLVLPVESLTELVEFAHSEPGARSGSRLGARPKGAARPHTAGRPSASAPASCSPTDPQPVPELDPGALTEEEEPHEPPQKKSRYRPEPAIQHWTADYAKSRRKQGWSQAQVVKHLKQRMPAVFEPWLHDRQLSRWLKSAAKVSACKESADAQRQRLAPWIRGP